MRKKHLLILILSLLIFTAIYFHIPTQKTGQPAESPPKAAELFPTALQINPEESDLREKASSFYENGCLNEAIATAGKLVEKFPENDTGYWIIGMSYWKQKNYKKSLEALRKAEKFCKDPEHLSGIYVGYALNDIGLGKTKDARRDIQKAIETNEGKKTSPMLMISSAILCRSDKNSEALSEIESLLARDPLLNGRPTYKAAFFYNTYSNILYKNGYIDRAIKYAKKSIEQDPSARQAYLTLVWSYEYKGCKKHARYYAQKYFQQKFRERSFDEMMYSMEAYKCLGNNRMALKLINRAIPFTENPKDILVDRGVIFFDLKDYKNAKKDFLAYLNSENTNDDCDSANLAKAYLKTISAIESGNTRETELSLKNIEYLKLNIRD